MKPATGYMMRQENGDVIGPIPETLLRFGLQHGELSPAPAPTSGASSLSDAAHSMVAAALAGVATMRGAGGKGGDDERKAEEADVYQRLANSAAADDQAKDELQRMRQAAAVRQWDQLRSEQLHAKNEVLRRLLSAPTDVAGALHIKLTNPGFHASLMTVKRALDEAALAGVRGAGATTKSDVFKTAMAHLRPGRFSRVRLAKLVGKQDDTTNTNPLHFLQSVKKAQSAAHLDYSSEIVKSTVVFTAALARMQAAYETYHPADATARSFFEVRRDTAKIGFCTLI